jgi:hypothetical protein
MKITINKINVERFAISSCSGEEFSDPVGYDVETVIQLSKGNKFDGMISFAASRFTDPKISDFKNAIAELFKEI